MDYQREIENLKRENESLRYSRHNTENQDEFEYYNNIMSENRLKIDIYEDMKCDDLALLQIGQVIYEGLSGQYEQNHRYYQKEDLGWQHLSKITAELSSRGISVDNWSMNDGDFAWSKGGKSFHGSSEISSRGSQAAPASEGKGFLSRLFGG